MPRKPLLIVGAILGLIAFSPDLPRVQAAPFRVLYRSAAGSPWTFYSGAPTRMRANAIASQLQASGYLTEVLTGDGGGAASSVYYAPSSFNNSSSYQNYS